MSGGVPVWRMEDWENEKRIQGLHRGRQHRSAKFTNEDSKEEEIRGDIRPYIMATSPIEHSTRADRED